MLDKVAIVQEQTIIIKMDTIQWFKVIPYITIIAVALCGVNVLLTLIIGIVVAGTIGLLSGDISPITILTSMGDGIEGMCELILVTMFAGGLLYIVKLKGGMDILVKALSAKVKGKRGAEASISFLTAVANICTANNTIAILTVGPIAKELSEKERYDYYMCNEQEADAKLEKAYEILYVLIYVGKVFRYAFCHRGIAVFHFRNEDVKITVLVGKQVEYCHSYNLVAVF